MKKLDVLGFGALNVDKLYNVNHIACEDEESYITNSTESCGGSAANTIIGITRLGLKTGFIGKISTDTEGKLLHDNLIKEGVDTQGIIISTEGRSGKVLGFIDKKGERALYVDSGVNDHINFSEIELGYVENSRALHLTSFVGRSIEAQKELIKNINDKILVSFDPGHIYVDRGIKSIQSILERSNILLINQAELKHLIGKKYKTYQQSAKILLDHGIDIVVVKLGERGCFIAHSDEEYFIKSFKVNCIDTTGAGDAFNAGFIHSYLTEKDIEKAGLIGNYVASCSIKKYGATSGLPNEKELKNISKNI
ncbi:MAG: carbohydrate kinase family protein [Methanobacteriaceae archaeon]|nr:carbohydrate kinase family protein [Methanobacteriaceae archaeon]